jgi:hypothetical protein
MGYTNFWKTGGFVRSLSRLSMQLYGSTSTALSSKSIAAILAATKELRELDLPTVELREQDSVIKSVCQMSKLRVLRMNGTASTSKWNDGDLRRISKACTAIEELNLYDQNYEAGDDTGYVDAFEFKNLKILSLENVDRLSDKHLVALISRAKGLEELIAHNSVVLEGQGPKGNRLTPTGIASGTFMVCSSLRNITLTHRFG